MKKFLLGFLLVALYALPAAAQPAPLSPNQANIGRLVSYYYMDKNPQSLKKLIELLQQSGMLEKKPASKDMVASFLSVIFAEHPEQIEAALKDELLSGKTKEAVQLALLMSGQADKAPATMQGVSEDARKNVINLADLKPVSAGNLDMLWAGFFASGDALYVKKIIDVLDPAAPLSGDAKMDAMIRMSADWSLGSNMIQHELVRRMVLAEEKTRTGAVKENLSGIIRKVNDIKKPFPHQDGEFSGMLIIVPDNQMKEFDKPSSEALQFSPAKQVKSGDIVGIKIAFGGMELDENLMADVTYDVKLLGPDGKIYDDTDVHDLEALKRKVATRFSVYDNLSYVKVQFEQKDKPGVYKAVAVLHDNIGKKKLELEETVELVK